MTYVIFVIFPIQFHLILHLHLRFEWLYNFCSIELSLKLLNFYNNQYHTHTSKCSMEAKYTLRIRIHTINKQGHVIHDKLSDKCRQVAL